MAVGRGMGLPGGPGKAESCWRYPTCWTCSWESSGMIGVHNVVLTKSFISTGFLPWVTCTRGQAPLIQLLLDLTVHAGEEPAPGLCQRSG